MIYDPESFTYGVELEYADVYVYNPLPDGCCWNDKDYSIVNSSGIANDPKRKLWLFGGEINTRPTDTIEEQIDVIRQINEMLVPRPAVNYKCNLHIHIGVPGLEHDLDGCKRLLRYITKYGRMAFGIVDPIPVPSRARFRTEDEYKGAMRRYKRNLVSHQHMIPDAWVANILRAETMEEFFNSHAPVGKNGNRLWNIAPRAGINIRQLQETKTVEFRHYFQTLNMYEIKSCLIWCREFMALALGSGEDPRSIIKRFPKLRFPQPMLYNHKLHQMFMRTNVHTNTRKDVERVLGSIYKILFVCTGNINRSPAAHTILNNILLDNASVSVDSAGVSSYNRGKLTTKRMRTALEERGYTYYPIRSKQVTKHMIDVADIVVCMSRRHIKALTEMFGYSNKYVLMSEFSSDGDVSNIPDPNYSSGMSEYRRVVSMLEDCCYNLTEVL